jgi:hypothetical protein
MAREQGHMVVDSSQWTLQRHTDPLDPEHETWVVTGYVVDLGEKEES